MTFQPLPVPPVVKQQSARPVPEPRVLQLAGLLRRIPWRYGDLGVAWGLNDIRVNRLCGGRGFGNRGEPNRCSAGNHGN